MSLRYTFGGDEFIFVEISEAMSLQSFFTSMAITKRLQEEAVAGVIEICPANASYQIRFNPDVIHPDAMLAKLQQLEQELSSDNMVLETRLIEIPVLYNDPWTNETGAKFRERHQDPSSTDLEYAARINGYPSIDDFITAHSASPWFVSMVGFVAGLPFMFQMVEQAKQLQVPKYLRPRTDTPKLTLGHGGCFSCIYSVRGAGGYQMFGVTPAPIYDPEQTLPYLKEMMVFFRPGDVVKFKPINRQEYDIAMEQVAAGTFDLTVKNIVFNLHEFLANPHQYNQQLIGAQA
ncbi:allophanate hydrolase subunit 1 [Vitreoscilla massiliensis]|uniref:Allophanate hydrolase subunit 1 n=1 Tax=Vitreoscilla massiliensis TaxID=1689272 RepID=A0ABY4E1U5_9NEIS|nr:allophanate hydrolase subunit 1 [Vitreoscilla massiliensis]UOO89731.1 allophanate hydrolase subunit 1 [Vitreoscilla massiliensis]